MSASRAVIWDLPTRTAHWLLAACVILNLFFLEEGEDWHRRLGYVALGTVAFRALWGFVGARASRFRSFPLRPSQIIDYLRAGLHERPGTEPGHNPLASLVYVAMWIAIIGLGTTGWMMGLDAFWGDERLEELHEGIANLVKILVVLHLLGMLIDSIRYRRGTWLGMITGRR